MAPLSGRRGRYPRPNAMAKVSAVPVNSHGAATASVTSIRSSAMNTPDAVSTCARKSPAKNTSGGHTTSIRSPLDLVYHATSPHDIMNSA